MTDGRTTRAIDMEELRRMFADPPAQYRGAPFWSWNDRLDGEELCRQIDQMKDGGWGGFFMHSREGLVTEYLSDEWMALVRRCVDHARARGMKAWLYDEDKWPSGFAGGGLPRLGEWTRQRFLVIHAGTGEPELGGYELSELSRTKHYGREYAFYIAVSALGNQWFNDTTYTDISDPDVMRAYLDGTHAKYRATVADAIPETTPGVFTDEPCWGHMGFGPEGALPWTKHLPEEFLKRKGYDLLQSLAYLFLEIPGYRRVRFDFFDVMTELFRMGFTQQYHDWCEKHGLALTGHFMREDGLDDQAAWIGAAMPHYPYMHWPGVDHLGRQTNLHLAQKQVASVASQLGKERVLCETFGASGQSISLEDMKWIVNYHLAMGINFINPHLALYSMRGARKRDYPPNIFFQQPWWREHRLLADYYARLSLMMAQGRRDCRVLVLHPVSTAWAEYRAEGTHASIRKLDEDFKNLLQWLLDAQIEFELGDEMVLREYARVAGKTLEVGRQQYELVIVPPGWVWRRETLILLQELLDSDGKVIRLGQAEWTVAGSEEGISDMTEKIPFVEWERSRVVQSVAEACAQNICVCADGTSTPDHRFHLHRRWIGDSALLFIANNHQCDEIQATIQIEGLYDAECWDATTGEVFAPPFWHDERGTVLEHHFAPVEGLLVLLKPAERPRAQPAAAKTTRRPVHWFADDWGVKRKERNALLLDSCAYRMPDGEWSDSRPVYGLAEDINGQDIELRYTFEVEELPVTAKLVIESPRDWEVFVNDTRVDRERFNEWWVDPSFQTAALTDSVRKGENTVLLQRRILDTQLEIEPIYIIGDFAVRFRNQGPAIGTEAQQVHGADLTREGYPFMPGRITLWQEFEFSPKAGKRYYIEPDVFRGTVMVIRVNGTDLPPVAWKPWRREITSLLKSGTNLLEIEVVSTLFNLCGPHHNRQGELYWVGPWMWAELENWTDDYFLMPFGLSGVALYESSNGGGANLK